MKEFNFSNNNQKVYFCGIGGISMSGLAEILNYKGFNVCGSDINSNEITNHLESLGIKIFKGQQKENITNDIDLIVKTAAIKQDNPELIAAEEYKIPIMERSEFLGLITKNYKYVTAVSGTHGKTTTTSMISQILLEAQKDPTISVGGILNSIHGNIRIGKSDYFVAEACEYCDSFLKLYPYIGIILNIEPDHLDYFKDIDHIRQSFTKFANLIPQTGTLIINSDIQNYEQIVKGLKCKVITFGSKCNAADFTAKNINYDDKGIPTFDIIYKDSFITSLTLAVPGVHNVYNSLAACAAAYAQNIEINDIVKGLTSFAGTHRRFEFKGKCRGVTIIDDYAHHPTEIKASLKIANNYNYNKLWCIFQPHTYSRTKELFDDFINSFDNVDKLIITDIYAAREKDTFQIHSKDLVSKLNSNGKDVSYIKDFSDIESYIIQNAAKDDLVITMGAGNVNDISDNLVLNLK